MAAVKPTWFGRKVSALLSTGKWLTGELTEVTDNYIVLETSSGEVQVMVHALIAVRPADEGEPREQLVVEEE